MKQMYYSMVQNEDTATINIYGDIASWAFEELGEVSAVTLSKQLETMGNVKHIDVYINSYGGEVAEGLAIYNALRRHPAEVVTYCDGFACSIASVIFMAGDVRIMSDSSLLMIHNAWTVTQGNAEELRKQADDLEKITQASVEAYKVHSDLSEEEIKALMDAESWILPEEALQYGFATAVGIGDTSKVSQSAKLSLMELVKKYRAALDDEEEPEEPETEEPEDDETEPPAPEEPETEEPEDPEEEPEEKEEKPAQKWSGFFNALL